MAGSSREFRNDINGLRAWAVLAVIFYHFGVPGFGGGFVGVDVFFVISGFLMTAVVAGGLERGTFSLPAFYLARGRRIVPALAVLCAALLVLGWWLLMPLDYKALGRHAALSLLFLSNFRFWREAGYFDAASHEKWLLHTWSLSVEWQFYLLLPLLLMAVWRLWPGRRPLLLALACGCVASLAASVLLTRVEPVAAFYLLPARAWELLAGGVAYLLADRLVLAGYRQALLEGAGLALVAGAVAWASVSTPWPGWHAAVPVAGTVAVLLAARDSRWTGNRAAQWLGTRSYSLYLWHWPLVVALAYLGWQAEPWAIAGGMALTLLLGHLSWRWVEVPLRQGLGRLRPLRHTVALAAAVIAVAVPAAVILAGDGVAGRFTADVAAVAAQAHDRNPRKDECHPSTGSQSPACRLGGPLLRAVMLGDSHANAAVSGLAAAAPSAQDGVVEWTYSGCPTLFGAQATVAARRSPGHDCSGFLAWALRELQGVPRNVPLVIVNQTTAYATGHNALGSSDHGRPLVHFGREYGSPEPEFMDAFGEHLVRTACLLAKDRPVYLVRPFPEMRVHVPNTLGRAMLLGRRAEVSIGLDEYRQRHGFVWAAQDAARERCGVKVLDPLPWLCARGRCQGARDGHVIYYDEDHLSEWGNKLLVPMFAEVFKP